MPRWGRRSAARLLTVTLAIALAGLLAAPAAHAAAPARSLTPFVSCYWDNGDGTVTVSVGVSSSNATTVSVDVGADNRITVGAIDRGQPTSFRPGRHENVWAATVTYSDLSRGINWSLTGNTVGLTAVGACSAKPVPAEGSALAVLVFAGVVTVAGALALSGRLGRRTGGSPA